MRSPPSHPPAQHMFEDRRRHERRRPSSDQQCSADERRRGERRRTGRRYQTTPWWLQINYAEEITGRDVATELRRIERARRHRQSEAAPADDDPATEG